MKGSVAIYYSIQARKEWYKIQSVKSFYLYFNIFYTSLSNKNNLTRPYQNQQYSIIDEVDTRGGGCQGCGRGRGCGRECGRVGRGGYGQGIGCGQYEPYHLTNMYGSFV